jgi:hypothetical protein
MTCTRPVICKSSKSLLHRGRPPDMTPLSIGLFSIRFDSERGMGDAGLETIGRIRREHLLKRKSIKEIARALRISRNTVRKVLRSGETSFEYHRKEQPRPKLGRWRSDLEALLLENMAKSSRERLTLIRIFEELRGRNARGHNEGSQRC